MNQLAMMLPVGEQGLAGMPQAAAAVPRGAPPDGTAFSLMLGEHLWTLPAITGAGGDEAMGTPMPAAAAGYDPAAVLQGLLAEIVNLAVDSAGGAEQLAGKLAARIRQAVAELASGKPGQTPEEDSTVTLDGAVAADPAADALAGPATVGADAIAGEPQLQQLIARLLQMAQGASPDPAAIGREHSERGETAGVQGTVPAKAAHGMEQRASPALLAPLVRQVMQQLFAELSPQSGNGRLGLREVAPAPAQPAAPVIASGSPGKQIAPQQPDAVIEFGTGMAEPLASDNGSAGRPQQAAAAPLLGALQSPRSPSADWFNSQAAGGKGQPVTGLHLPPAGAMPVATQGLAAPLPQAGQAVNATASPVGDLLEAEIELPGSMPLKLAVSTVRSTALEPASRFDVTISDPAGGSAPMTVSMELHSVGPDRLYSGQEMQRISEAMERALSGEKPAVAEPERAVARPAGLAQVRGAAIPETDNQPGGTGPVRAASPAVSPVQPAEPVAVPQRSTAVPESDVATTSLPDDGKAARPDSLLSSMINRRDRAVAVPEAETALTGSSRGHAPLHPVDSVQPGSGLLSAHPQVGADVPQRLLQFSAPQVGTDISGYALDEIRQQLMDKVSELRNAGNGLYNLKLDLYPKELGRMIVNIAVRGDNVAMQVAVLNRGQRDQLQKSLAALRDSLEEDGLSVVDMRVLDISGGAGQQQAAG